MKRIKIIAFLLAVLMTVSGCANIENIIIIKTNGYGSQSIYLNIDREKYLSECSGGKKLSDSEIADIDANFANQGATRFKVGMIEYYRLPVTENNKMDNEELLGSLYIPGTVAYVTGDTFYWNVSVSKIMSNEFSDQNLEELGVERADLNRVPMTLTVQFSNKIAGTNGSISSANGKRVTFDVSNDENAPLFATTVKGRTQTDVVTEIATLNNVATSKIKTLKANKIKEGKTTASVKCKIKKAEESIGYQIQYSEYKNFKTKKTKTVTKTSFKIGSLKQGTKYYFKVRVLKKNYAGITLYGKWSKKKSITTQKKG